jgi:hypothetical protein
MDQVLLVAIRDTSRWTNSMGVDQLAVIHGDDLDRTMERGRDAI